VFRYIHVSLFQLTFCCLFLELQSLKLPDPCGFSCHVKSVRKSTSEKPSANGSHDRTEDGGQSNVPVNSGPACVILDLPQMIERKPFRKFMYEPTGLRLLIYYAGDHHIKPRLPCSCLYQKTTCCILRHFRQLDTQISIRTLRFSPTTVQSRV
jgi:hypothetical protein